MRLVLFNEVSLELRHCLTSLEDTSTTHLVWTIVRELEAGRPISDSGHSSPCSVLTPTTRAFEQDLRQHLGPTSALWRAACLPLLPACPWLPSRRPRPVHGGATSMAAEGALCGFIYLEGSTRGDPEDTKALAPVSLGIPTWLGK